MATLSRDQKLIFAEKCETTLGHLQNVMYGLKSCATDLAVSIEKNSKRAVTRMDLRADWRRHWPELDAKVRRATRKESATKEIA